MEKLRWRKPIASVNRFHPGWQRIEWTDQRADAYVAQQWPQLLPIFRDFPRGIMRADVIRYVAMHDFGGVYCDLDFEFLRAYNYSDAQVVLSLEFDRDYGDARNSIAGHFFASVPRHPFWRDILDEVLTNPPTITPERGVVAATGPGLLTRTYFANASKYTGVRVTPRPVFSPVRQRGRSERRNLLANGQTVGFHHASGSWKERWTISYFQRKLAKTKQRFTGNRAA